jgi:hypothetical protein
LFIFFMIIILARVRWNCIDVSFWLRMVNISSWID